MPPKKPHKKSRNAEYNLAGKQRAQEYDLQLFLAYQLNVKQSFSRMTGV